MISSTDITPLSFEQAADRLQTCHILPTQQRLQIARVLLTHPQHVSAEQVLELVNRDDSRVSKATVYNTLGLFARKGIVREVIVDPSRVFYDTNNSPHHHFYNIDTGELSDIKPSEVSVDSLPKAPDGTIIDSMNIIIRVREASTERH